MAEEAEMPKQDSASNLTAVLTRIQNHVETDDRGSGDSISLGEILDVIGRQAYGPLLLIIGLMSVSPLSMIPGSTWAFALLTLLVAVQMALHKKHPWLPKAALKLSFPEDKVEGALKKARPWTKVVDKIVKPRLEFLAHEPWIVIAALLAIVAAILTFPLSLIPFAPAIPGAAIILVGLGITARDGVVLGFAMLVMGGVAVWLGMRFL
jgi:hypothetical protein